MQTSWRPETEMILHLKRNKKKNKKKQVCIDIVKQVCEKFRISKVGMTGWELKTMPLLLFFYLLSAWLNSTSSNKPHYILIKKHLSKIANTIKWTITGTAVSVQLSRVKLKHNYLLAVTNWMENNHLQL